MLTISSVGTRRKIGRPHLLTCSLITSSVATAHSIPSIRKVWASAVEWAVSATENLTQSQKKSDSSSMWSIRQRTSEGHSATATKSTRSVSAKRLTPSFGWLNPSSTPYRCVAPLVDCERVFNYLLITNFHFKKSHEYS